jgi:hypothetical protein
MPRHRALALVLGALLLCLAWAPSASADGGMSPDGPKAVKEGGAYKDARLVNGKAIAPETAPSRIKRAIRFANRIRKTRYQWGGGHGSFEDRGYDCSGAVSYMLHGARMLKAPTTSGGLMSWGKKHEGKWLTVYANGGHTYAVVAGLRWDTSGGPGPRWHKDMRSSGGFRVRHYPGH